MKFHHILCLFASLFSLLLVNGQNRTEDQLQLKGDEEGAVVFLFQQAQHFLDAPHSATSIDSSLVFYDQAYSLWRKLDSKTQKKLAKQKIDNSSFRKLKNKIRSRLLETTYAQNTLEAFEKFQQEFSRLPGREQETFLKKRNLLAFEEAEKLWDFNQIDSIYRLYESDIQYYSPELTPKFDTLVLRAFFEKYDESVLYNLLYFINKFPRQAGEVDSLLAEAFERTPFVEMVERYILPSSVRAFPRTAEKIYPYYRAWGKVSDLMRFAEKYPDFTQSTSFINDLNNFKQAAYKLVSEHEEHLSDYIQLTAPNYRAFTSLQNLIAENIEQKEWEQAALKVAQHLPYFGKDTTLVKNLIDILRAPEEKVDKTLFDSIYINTVLQEYAPVVSSDGSKVFFCRRGDGSEDIFTAKKDENGWRPAFPLESINSAPYNEAPLSISADGTTLLLFEEGVVKVSELSKKGWSTPKAFFPAKLQSEWQGGTSISSDKNAVIFTARRSDRIGIPKNPVKNIRGEDENNDLYVSLKQPNGSWGFPVNLGKVINTPYEERSPFLHPDMRTLYFSSNGHGGLGDLDVFKTTRIGDGWNEWTQPVNLGKSINTTGRDWGYRISTDGQYAYYSAEVEGKQSELFKLTLPTAYRPEVVATVKGKLLDPDGYAIEGRLVVTDLELDSVITTVVPEPLTGDYYIVLPKGRLYAYHVEAEEYFPVSGHIDLRDMDRAIHAQSDIIVPNTTQMNRDSINIRLNNIFFEHDKATLQIASYPELNRIVDFLSTYPHPIEIAGHTDDTGSVVYNQELSERRAAAVRNFLIDQGCKAELISAKGYGMSKPLAANETEEGRAKNRRVEIKFLPVEK